MMSQSPPHLSDSGSLMSHACPGYLSKPLDCLTLITVNMDIVFLCCVIVQGEKSHQRCSKFLFVLKSSKFMVHWPMTSSVV